MSEWVIVAIAAILAILSRLESINIKFKGNSKLDENEPPKQLKE